MSQTEIDRLSIIQRIENRELSQIVAAKSLNLTTRQVRRLQRKFQANGAQGLISKRRGKPSNNKLSTALKEQVINMIKLYYRDFKPTFAHEKLTEKHGVKISVESVRRLMIENNLWKGKKRKSTPIHQTRARRSQYGELIQIDGSPHAWFEERREPCCLLVFIDDATSRLMQLLFVEQECTQGYFEATKRYVKKHGRPLEMYSDKHTIFRVQIQEAESGTGETQFGRALRELGIKLICANSPQAKGRVERANSTLQDRLVKEMRLRNISDIQSANAFLPEFIEDYNRRFAVAPTDTDDAHRKTLPDDEVLEMILCQQHTRKLSKNLELSYQNVTYQIQSQSPGYAMRRACVKVIDQRGKIILLYKGKKLAYKTIDKGNQPAVVKTSKEIRNCSKMARKPKEKHPWRQYALTQAKQKQKANKKAALKKA